jgi:hypothetical protein
MRREYHLNTRMIDGFNWSTFVLLLSQILLQIIVSGHPVTRRDGKDIVLNLSYMSYIRMYCPSSGIN